MGIYGVDFYGTSFYGAPLFLSFDARPFTAEPVGYGALRLRWTNPRLEWIYDPQEDEWTLGGEGRWSQLRVVRSSYGFPMFPEDGVIVLEKGTESITTLVDDDVREGRFYYYSIFVFETENEQWIRAGDTIGLPTENHAYGQRLFKLMPQFMQWEDLERSTGSSEGPLLRYLNTLGISLDHLRTEYETLRWMRNPERISGGLIWPLAQMFGIPFEPAIGMRQARVWLRDAVYLYRIKGTRPGVEAAASAITGWGARVTYGKNIFRAEGVAGWYSDADLTNTAAPDNPQTPAMLIESDTSATIFTAPPEYIGSGNLPKWYGLPVTELTDYSLSASIRPPSGTTAGRDFRWRVEWHAEDGSHVSTTDGDSVNTEDATWVDLELVANSPAEAAYAVVILEDLGSGETKLLTKAMQFEAALAPTAWQPARAIIINFDPVRWNFLPNPAFNNGLFGWAVTDGTAGLADGSIGPASGNQHATLLGAMESILLGVATSGVPHVFSAYTEGEARVKAAISWYEDPEDEDPVRTDEEEFEFLEGTNRFAVSSGSPADSTFARVSVEGERRDGNALALDGTSGTYASAPDVNLLDADTAHLHQSSGKWGSSSGTLSSHSTERSVIGDGSFRAERGDSGLGHEARMISFSDGFPVTSGLSYTFSVAVAAKDPYSMRLGSRFWDSDGNILPSPHFDSNVPGGYAWTEIQGTFEAPEGATRFGWTVAQQDGGNTGDVFHVDAACLRQGTNTDFVPSHRITGDLDVRVIVASDSWPPSSEAGLVSKRGPSGNRSWRFSGSSDGRVLTRLCEDGINEVLLFSPVGAPSNVPGNYLGFRFTWRQSDKAFQYFFSEDRGQSWYPAGGSSPINIDSIFPSSSAITIGSSIEGAITQQFDGFVYSVEVRDGIDGLVVAQYDARDQELGTPDYTDELGNVWTLNGNAEIVENIVPLRIGSTLFEEGSVPGDYFDGDFFGADYLWAGTPGTSASKYYPSRAERNVRVRELIIDYLPLGQNFLLNYVGGAPSAGELVGGEEGDLGVGAYGIMPFGQ